MNGFIVWNEWYAQSGKIRRGKDTPLIQPAHVRLKQQSDRP
jgi:hypothetical protein